MFSGTAEAAFMSKALVEIARKAGDIIMGYYEGEMNARLKDDRSPVTDADMAANEYIVKQLQAVAPGVLIVSEEGEQLPLSQPEVPFFLVDPLDGTKSFIRRTGEFTVNIGLIVGRSPVMGVVYIPVQKKGYIGHVGVGAERWLAEAGAEPITTRAFPADGMDVVVSHSHRSPETDAYLSTITTRHIVSAASSLKFCVVAEGGADIYPRFGTTMEWDTAAGHAVLLAAGGKMVTPQGEEFRYAKPGFTNGNFIASGVAV